jgi:RNA polymerase sigma-70 factor, ECF subfamily
MRARTKIDYADIDDVALARGFAERQPDAVRLITERNNQRLFRAAWAILRNRAEAEDAVQSAYLRAFAAAATFEGRSSLTTWLTRIVINEALGRRRAASRRMAGLDGSSVTVLEDYRDKMMRGSMSSMLPDGSMALQQIRQLLENAIARLPESFRIVFILREIEGLSVEEVADTLQLNPATVKTRDLRARRRLQEELEPELRSALSGTFPFAGADCVAMTERVLDRICGGASGTAPVATR